MASSTNYTPALVVGMLILALVMYLRERRAPRNDDVSDPLLQQQLALGAIYGRLNSMDERTLSGRKDMRHAKEVKQMLETVWHVGGREAPARMREQMNAGLQSGHRSDPGLCRQAERLAAEERAQTGQAVDAGASASLAHRALLAWDVARYANLARHGFYVGYLTRAEALGFLRQAHELSFDQFDSWADFGEGVLFSKRVFDAQLTPAEKEAVSRYDDLADAMHALLRDPQSAWNRVAWAVSR